MPRPGHLRIALGAAAMATTGNHEQAKEIVQLVPKDMLHLAAVLDRPRRRVVRVRPALRDDQLAAALLEAGQVGRDLVDQRRRHLVHQIDVGGPVELRVVVTQVLEDEVLQDRNAVFDPEAGFLRLPLGFGAERESGVDRSPSIVVRRAGVEELGVVDLSRRQTDGSVICDWLLIFGALQ